MCKTTIVTFCLPFFLALSVNAQAEHQIQIDGAAPAAPTAGVYSKAAAGSLVNLEVISFTGPGAARQGDDLLDQMDIVFSNAGPDAIQAPFNLVIALSDTLGGRPEGDTVIGSRLFYEELAPGNTGAGFSQVLVPLTLVPGDYYLVLKLDVNAAIAETDETDNTASVPLTISERSHLSLYYEDFQEGAAGWTAQDETEQSDLYFSRVDYPVGPDTLGVWWCGDNNPAWVDSLGYGNNWDQRLEKDFPLPAGVECTFSYTFQYDSEAGHDYIDVDVSNTGGTSYQTLARYDGTTAGAFITATADLSAFAGQTVRIRFRFVSDEAYSDEDGAYLSDGAFRLDAVTVTGSPTDDFEIDGNGWLPTPALAPSSLFRVSEDTYCPPGYDCDHYATGGWGVFCNAWVAYDPVTREFPDSPPVGSENYRTVWSTIVSPPVDISSVQPADKLVVSFDVLKALPLENGVFYFWYIRDDMNGNWRSFDRAYYGVEGWTRDAFDVTQLVTPGASSLQLKLGATDLGGLFGSNPLMHSSAPYFDNVGVILFSDTATPGPDPEPRVCGWAANDTDGDGVPDAADLCPTESASFFDRDGDGCIDPVTGGRHIEYWDQAAFPLTYYINEAGAPGVTDGSDLAAVNAGFDAWTTVPGTDISVSYGGTTTDGDAKALDMVNTVTFADPDYVFPAGVLAVGLSTSYITPVIGTTTYRPGQIIDSDMIFNPGVRFRTATDGTGTDIQSVVTHEVGHMLGLSHSAVQTSTMFYVLPPGAAASLLAPEDMQAIRKAYPDEAALAVSSHLRGTVVDGANGEPIAGAIVFAIEALPGGALGDTLGCDFTLPINGSYHFIDLPDGDYYVAIHPLNGSSRIGFLQPGNINQMMLTNAQTVFPAEFYDAAESNADLADDRAMISVFAPSTATANLITNLDSTPPMVLATAPVTGDGAVAVSSALSIKFSEAMDATSFQGNFQFRSVVTQTSVAGNAALASDDSTLLFIPSGHLDFATDYEVEILGGVRDLFGNTMGAPVALTFTTEQLPSVYIDNLTPSKAIAGSIVMINGLGFNADKTANSVTFDGTDIPVLAAETGQLTVVVPDGLVPGPVTVAVSNTNGNASALFNLLAPEDVARGHEIATVDLPSLPRQVAISPDGNFAYVATATGLAVLNVSDSANPVLHFMAVPDGLEEIAVAPGGSSIFGINSTGQRYLRFHFDNAVAEPANPVTLVNEVGVSGLPVGIRIGPSGQRAYIAIAGGEIQIWDTEAANATHDSQIGSLSGVDSNLLGDMAIDPAESRLLALVGTGKMQAFDLVADTLMSEVLIQSDPTSVSIDPAGQFAFVTDGAGILTIISLSTLQAVTDIAAGGDLRGAAVTPAGSFAYAANYERDVLDVIDLRAGAATYQNVVMRIPSRVNPLDLSFSPDGVFAYSLVEAERKFVVSAMGTGPALTSVTPPNGPVGARVVLTGSGFTDATVTVNGLAAVIERSTDTALTIEIPAGAQTGPITVLGLVPGEVSNSTTFKVLEPGLSGSLRLAGSTVAPGGTTLVPSLAASPLGGQLATADLAGNVYLLDIRPGSPTYHEFTAVNDVFTTAVSALAYSPDGSRVYAVAAGKPVFVAIDAVFGNTTYGQPVQTVPLPSSGSDHLTVAPDGSVVLLADPVAGGVWLVTPADGSARFTAVPQGAVGAMAFHPGNAYAYLTVAADDPAVVLVMELSDSGAGSFGTIVGQALLPGTAPAEIPLSLAFTPTGAQCLVLTSQMTGTPNRSVVSLNTMDPAAPSGAVVVGTFPTTAAPVPENLVVSPVGDRAILNISGSGLFQATVAPWGAGPVPEYPTSAPQLGMAYSPDGAAFYVVDPTAGQVLSFDFGGDLQLVPVWGQDQTGVIGKSLSVPLRIRVVDQNQEGTAAVPLTFTIATGDGHFDLPTDSSTPQTLNLATDIYGFAQVPWVLGPNEGSQSVQVFAQGVAGSPWTFNATAIADPELLPLALLPDLLAPAADAADVSVTTAIQVVFTRPIEPLSVFEDSYYLWDLTDNVRVPVVYGFADQDRSASLTPVTALDFGKQYQVTVSATIRVPGAGALTNPTQFRFGTEQPPAVPVLTSISPPSAVPTIGLVLAGTGFDPRVSGNQVLFHPASGGPAIAGFVSEAASDFIATAVPIEAKTGTITVESGGQTTNSLPFAVLTPTTSLGDDILATITTGSATKSVVVAPDGALAYAVSPESDLLIPVDLGTLLTLPGIPVGDEPWAIGIHPEGRNIYVVNRRSGDVAVIDTEVGSPTWHQVQAFVPVGLSPVDIGVSPTGDRVFVANSQSDDLSVIDTDHTSATFNSVIATLGLGRPAKSVTVAPDGGRVYVGTNDGYIVLESLDFGILATLNNGRASKSVTVSPDGALLIFLDTAGEVTIFDVAEGSPSENQILATLHTGSPIKSATVSPDGALLAVVLEQGDIVEVYDLDVGASVDVLDPNASGAPVELRLVSTLVAGENPQAVAFDPQGTGRFVVSNAGDQTVSLFHTQGPGWLRGTVVADCPNPDTPLLGVDVDVFADGTGDMTASLVTDEFGVFAVELPAGLYHATMVTPLGMDIENEDQALTITAADSTSLNWSLTCDDIVASPRRMSFWKHQIGAALNCCREYQIDGPTLCGYLDQIELHFNNHRLNQVVVYQPPPSGLCVDKLQVTKDLMNLAGDEDMLSHARQQLMALLFNVSSGKLALSEVVSQKGTKVSQVITYVDQLIDDGDPANDMKARSIAKTVNRGHMLRDNDIPDYLPDISYGIVPRRFKLEQNFPNPFNPKATIKFEVARPGRVRIVIYDIAGRVVRTLVDEVRNPSRYEVVWDGTNDKGATQASGVYFCRMVAGSFTQVAKMVLLK